MKMYSDFSRRDDKPGILLRQALRDRINRRVRALTYAQWYTWAQRLALAYVRAQASIHHPGAGGSQEAFRQYMDAEARFNTIALIWHEATIHADRTLREYLVSEARKVLKQAREG